MLREANLCVNFKVEFTKTEQSLYYGFCMCIFSTAGYKLSGGAFNLSLAIGGMIFNRVITTTITAMFIGSILGCITARMFYDQFLKREAAGKLENQNILSQLASKKKVD